MKFKSLTFGLFALFAICMSAFAMPTKIDTYQQNTTSTQVIKNDDVGWTETIQIKTVDAFDEIAVICPQDTAIQSTQAIAYGYNVELLEKSLGKKVVNKNRKQRRGELHGKSSYKYSQHFSALFQHFGRR